MFIPCYIQGATVVTIQNLKYRAYLASPVSEISVKMENVERMLSQPHGGPNADRCQRHKSFPRILSTEEAIVRAQKPKTAQKITPKSGDAFWQLETFYKPLNGMPFVSTASLSM